MKDDDDEQHDGRQCVLSLRFCSGNLRWVERLCL